MAITVAAYGTQVCTVTTEHSLTVQTAAGVYVLQLDLNVCVAGDAFEVRFKTNILAAGTERTAFIWGFRDDRPTDEEIVQSDPFIHDGTAANFEVTLKQSHGTSRSVIWKLLKVA